METGPPYSSPPKDDSFEINGGESLDASFTLSNLLSSVLGSIDDDFNNDLDCEELASFKAFPSLFDCADSTQLPENASQQPANYSSAVPDQVLQSYDGQGDEIPLVTKDDECAPDTDYSNEGLLLKNLPTTLGQEFECPSNLPPFTEVLKSSGCSDRSCDGPLVPWAPQTEFPPVGTPQASFRICNSASSDSGKPLAGSCYFGPRQQHNVQSSKRLEHLVSIKIENPSDYNGPGNFVGKNPPNVLPSLTVESHSPLQWYANHHQPPPISFSDSGIVQNYAQHSRVWGLTVEQWKTQQTTFRWANILFRRVIPWIARGKTSFVD